MTESFELEELLHRYAAGSCTRGEYERLLFLVARLEAGETGDTALRRTWDSLQPPPGISPMWQKRLTSMLKESIEEAADSNEHEPMVPKRSRRWLVAAAVTFFIVAGYFMHFVAGYKNGRKETGPVVKKEAIRGHDRAVLELGDGRQIGLDTAARGDVAVQAGVRISKTAEGEVNYYPRSGNGGSTEYNSITVPRSGNYVLILSDGTRVHLNAESSLRFPVSFKGASRDVELTGEGFFDVVKNPSRPFHVKTKGFTVEVFGTHFNVKTYAEDGNAAATLVEGKVRIRKDGHSRSACFSLKPGQQAQLDSSGILTLNASPNLDETLAWQSNTFKFVNRPVSSVLQDIGRWYDVAIEYHGALRGQRLTGTFSRSTDLAELAAMLRYAGVKIKISQNHSMVVGE